MNAVTLQRLFIYSALMNKTLYTLALVSLCLLLTRSSASAQLSCDSAFNRTGYHLFTPNTQVRSLGLKVVAGPDGSVFVAGIRAADSLAIWKYTADGSLDPAFGYGGFRSVYTGAGGYELYPMSVELAIQRDGKPVVMATRWRLDAQKFGNTLSDIVLARFRTDGAPDPGFNSNGLLIHRPDAGFQYRATALALDSTGTTDKIYVASLATENSNWSCPLGFGKWCVSRYSSDGKPDAGLLGTGFVQQSAAYIRNAPTASPMAVPKAMRVLPSGALLVAGAYNAADSGCFVFRMLPGGGFDPAFGQGGRVFRKWADLASVTPDDFRAQFLADGSVVFSLHRDLRSGTQLQYDSSLLYAIRQDASGQPALTFGSGGTMTTSYRNEGFHELSADADNRLSVCWNEADGVSQRMHFRRFTAQGQADQTFGTGGHASIEPIRNDAVYSASYVYGTAWTADGRHFFVQEQRFDKAHGMHMGLIKYRFGAKAAIAAGIAEKEQATLIVYPQPAVQTLHISSSGAPLTRISLLNASGQLVLQQAAGTQRTTLEVGQLPSGVYILRGTDQAGATFSRRIVIAH